MSQPPPHDRRSQPRHMASVVIEVDAKATGDSSVSVLREISLSGARFLTNKEYRPGDQLQLAIHLTTRLEGECITADCEVIRSGTLSQERMDLWRREVAVRFDTELTEHAAALKLLSERVRAGAKPSAGS